MRKNTARHWLHAALDLLPVILIPVFMIYSHRHVLTERTEVDIQYKYQSNDVNTYDDLIIGNIYSYSFINIYNYNDSNYHFTLNIYKFDTFSSNNEDYDLIGFNNENYNSKNFNFLEISYNYPDGKLKYTNNKSNVEIQYNDIDIEITNFVFSIEYGLDDFVSFIQNDLDVLPSYTDYNVIESVDVQDTNSSIMNVFIDDFNYTVNKYFNMGNVFNLKDVYHWFEVNIFNNNPPVVMASIYNIIVYEFVMDLLFLLYGLFMWFVDMLKRLIEKPIDSIK